MAKAPATDFTSPAEFEAVCRHLSRRLHYINRVAAGESGAVWALADLLNRVGPMLARVQDDPGIKVAFGDGWTAGEIDRADRPAALFAVLYPEVAGFK